MERFHPKTLKKFFCHGRLRQYELYIIVGGFLAIVVVAGVLYDALDYTVFRSPLKTTQGFTYEVLVLHVVAFFSSISAFVSATLLHKTTMGRISFVLIVCNGLSFLARIIMEMVLINYRVEYYH